MTIQPLLMPNRGKNIDTYIQYLRTRLSRKEAQRNENLKREKQRKQLRGHPLC